MVRRKGDSRLTAERGSPGKPPTATCQKRINAYSGVEWVAEDGVLSAYTELYSRVECKLFAQVAGGPSSPEATQVEQPEKSVGKARG